MIGNKIVSSPCISLWPGHRGRHTGMHTHFLVKRYSILHYKVNIFRDYYTDFLLSLKGVPHYPKDKVCQKYTDLYGNN